MSFSEIMKEVIRREKEAGITPDPDVDTYMKVIKTLVSNAYPPSVHIIFLYSLLIICTVLSSLSLSNKQIMHACAHMS